MIPDERTCQYFLTITREKNISRAARCLYISQPSLSRFLSSLEKELGVSLFLRANGQLSLTENGNRFHQYITELKELEAHFIASISPSQPPHQQILKIGAGSITCPILAEKILPILRLEYPAVKIQLIEDVHTSLISKFDRGELDLAYLVASGADTISSSHVKILVTLPRLFIISHIHPLSALVQHPETNSIDNPQLISPLHLNNQTLITGMPGQKIRDDLMLFINKHRIRVSALLPLQTIATGLAMAECDLGIAVMPGFYIRSCSTHPNLLYLYLDDPLTYWRMTVRHKNSRISPVERRFIELSSKMFSGENPA